MKITVERFTDTGEATISLIRVDGSFVCFGLEDQHQTEKVYGETRIPSGKYKIGVRTEGGFNERYAKQFRDIHAGMLQVMDVPGFTNILIHIGNTDDDTAGCLLVGDGAHKGGTLQQSRNGYRNLYRRVIDQALINDLEIEFINAEQT